ncbi:unnamed protein product [Peniophora sp. CBMAI 1063]|nr:unnamed protein product [Peniophora sp. CBMAI 1063]
MPNFRDSASSCDVCLEPYREKEANREQHILVPCGHMYCFRCIQGLRGLCPSCRKPYQQHIQVWHDAPRSVSPSQMLLDAKENVRIACFNLDRYEGLGSDFHERVEDLLALCVPKEESEDRILPVLQAIERLVLGFKDAHAIAARESHRMHHNVQPAREREEARQNALIELLLQDVEVLQSRLEAHQSIAPVAADMPRSKRLTPILAPNPLFGRVDPLAPGAFYYVGPPPGHGVKLGRQTPARTLASPRTSRDELLNSYLERVQDKLDRAEQEDAARRAAMPDYYAAEPPTEPLLLNTHEYDQDVNRFPLADALGLQRNHSSAGLGLGFDSRDPIGGTLFR